MSIDDILKIESDRQDQNKWNIIHFIKEGNFYRVYDWSAWLAAKFYYGEKSKDMKFSARKLKTGSLLASWGFPATSIANHIQNSENFSPEDNNVIDVKVTLPPNMLGITYNEIVAQKEEWVTTLPLKETRNVQRESHEIDKQSPRLVKITDVISRIISLPLDRMSPREAWDELYKLRSEVTAIF